MSPNTRLLLYALGAVVVLNVLIARFKLHRLVVLIAVSVGATRIATALSTLFGEKRVHWAFMFVAFIVGIPVFFQVGFVLLIPLVFTIARRTGMSLVKIGIPLVAGLSVVHGMVPPHPAAMLAVA